MKRIENVRAILFVHEQDDAPTYGNKVRMRHVKASTIGEVNYKGLKLWSQAIADWLEV